MHKGDKCCLDHCNEIMQNTACVQDQWSEHKTAERSPSAAYVPSSTGKMSEKEKREKLLQEPQLHLL